MLVLHLASTKLVSANSVCKCENGDVDSPSKKVTIVFQALLKIFGLCTLRKYLVSSQVTVYFSELCSLYFQYEDTDIVA